MEILNQLPIMFVFSYVFLESLNWLYWIQDKEYRIDRFLVFAKSLDARRELGFFFKITLVIVGVLSAKIFGDKSTLILVFIILNLRLGYKYIHHILRRPVLTQRAKRIFATSSIMSIFVLYISYLVYGGLIIVIFTEAIMMLSVVAGVYWTSLVTIRIKNNEKKLALSKLEDIKPFVIGITGSYGKTTTKEFLFTILSQFFPTAKNEGSQDTEFGVIRAVNKFLNKDIKYLIVEAGAYRKGEIRSICDIVRPKMAILTGLEPQHLELFGNMENLISAKSELIESLPDKGIAIFNLNNKLCENLYEKYKHEGRLRVYGYKTGVGKNIDQILISSIIEAKKNSIDYEYVFEGSGTRVSTLLNNKSFIENLSAAIVVARLIGISNNQIKRAVAKVQLPDKTMKEIKLRTGATAIDDSFNTNPAGFTSALEYIKQKKGRKYVFTTGIIELGGKSYEVHKKLGELMKSDVESVFLRNSEFENALKQGLGKESAKLKVVTDIDKITSEFENCSMDKNAIILLEGKLPQKLLNKFKSIQV